MNMAIARQRIHLPPSAWTRAIGAGFNDAKGGPETIERFEKAFAEAMGSPDAVAVPSGRAGLKFTIDALDLDPGSEIICSAFAYPVVPYIAHTMGYSVRFADCELQTLGMDPDSLEPRTCCPLARTRSRPRCTTTRRATRNTDRSRRCKPRI
jgi:hypothetical protein